MSPYAPMSLFPQAPQIAGIFPHYQWFPGLSKEILTISNFHLLQNLTSRCAAISLDENMAGPLRTRDQQAVAWEAESESAAEERTADAEQGTEERQDAMFLVVLPPVTRLHPGYPGMFLITTTLPHFLSLACLLAACNAKSPSKNTIHTLMRRSLLLHASGTKGGTLRALMMGHLQTLKIVCRKREIMHSQLTAWYKQSDTQREGALFPGGSQFPIFSMYSMTQL